MNIIAYYRVSTSKQGKSGLGLEAQREAVASYANSQSMAIADEFTEIKSGSKNDRTQLTKALRKCRLSGDMLVIAKLDRLSRNALFLMELLESKVKFVCADMPEANDLTVGMLAVLAEYERKLISERTKAALQAAKARGVKLGNPNIRLIANRDPKQACLVNAQKAKERNIELLEVINEIEHEAGETLSSRVLAEKLNESGYRTARGCEMSAMAVLRAKQAA